MCDIVIPASHESPPLERTPDVTTTDQPTVVYDAVRTPAHFEVALDATHGDDNPAGDIHGYIAIAGIKIAEGTWPAGTTHEDILTDWLQRLAVAVAEEHR